MKRDAIVIVVVIAAVALMITSAAYLARHRAAPGSGPQAGGAIVNGSQAPDFELATLDGKKLKLSDLRGKAVLLNFWATWCAPCKVEMPWLEELHKQYSAQGLEVVGVAMDDAKPEEVRKFAKEVGVSYTIVMGKEAVGEAYGGVQFLPASFYIDRRGKIVDRVFGLVSHKEIEDNIRKALGPATAQNAPAPAPQKTP